MHLVCRIPRVGGGGGMFSQIRHPGRRGLLLFAAFLSGVSINSLARAEASPADIAKAKVEVAKAKLALAEAELAFLETGGKADDPSLPKSPPKKAAAADSTPKSTP